MRIAILTLGSRGDVQPYLAFAKYAVKQGHEAVICTGKTFENFITENGVEFAEAESDLMAILKTPEGQMVFNHALRHPIKTKAFVSKVINPAFRKTLDQFWTASQGADVILYHPKAFGAPDIAKALGIPCISMPPVPMTYPIEEFPNLAISPKKSLGKWLNKLSYKVVAMAESASIKEVNAFRKETLGLSKRKAGLYTFDIDGTPIPVIYPISKFLFEDVTSWNGSVFLSGFLFLDTEKEKLDEMITHFLEAGPAPIVISFSSMPLKQPDEFKRILIETLSLTGDRAILLTGSTGLTFEGYDHILTIASAPHDLLFEHAKGIVHHGGVGTMASALKSGKTQLIMPFGVDQPFWASRLYKMGITLQPLKEKELSVQNLVLRFKAMNEKTLQSPAQVIKSKMGTEHGCKATLDFINSIR